MLGKPDPLDAAAARSSAATSASAPLDDDEIASLFGLVLLRLCTSVCVAARQQTQRPGDPYLSVSQGADRAHAAARWPAIDPTTAEAAFRHARGRTPEETLAARRRVIGPNLSVAYRAAGEDRPRLDAVPLRPDRPALPRRLQQRAARRATAIRAWCRRRPSRCCVLNTNTRYLHDSLAAFAERLIATLPAPLARLLLRQLRQRSQRAGAAAGARPHAPARRRSSSTPRITATPRRSSTSVRTSSTARAAKGRRRGCTCCRCPTPIAGSTGATIRAPARSTRSSPGHVRESRRRSSPRARRASADRSSCRIGYLRIRLRDRPRGRRRLHRRRSADGLRADGHALLRLRSPARRPRHRRAREADRQRLSARRRGDDGGDRGVVRQRHGVLQHVRRQHRVVRRRAWRCSTSCRRSGCRSTRATSAMRCWRRLRDAVGRPSARRRRRGAAACSSASSW